MRLIDADKVPPLSDLSGCGYEGSEYQAYKSGAEYGRLLVDDAPTIDPESLLPTAHWIQCDFVIRNYDDLEDTIYRGLGRKCSRCARIYDATKMDIKTNYCPHCGARVARMEDTDESL